MAKFKHARGKAKPAADMPRAGLPCLVLVVAIIVMTMLVMYYALKSSAG